MSEDTRDQEPLDTPADGDDVPEHQKPENLENLKDHGKDQITPGTAGAQPRTSRQKPSTAVAKPRRSS